MKRRLLISGLLSAVAAVAGSLANTMGVYNLGGSYPTSMSEGVERIAQLGGHVARVALSPTYYSEYNAGTGCYPGYSLSAIARQADVKRALDNESIAVFMLTAYDGATFGDCQGARWVNPSFYTPANMAALVLEYSDFTLYLYQTYQGTNKQFIVSDWESDNAVYCGQAYTYATQPKFRSDCDVNYAALYGNSSAAESIEGLKLWYQTRQQGIAEGRNRAAAEGLAGVRVLFAPEFCSVHALHDAGFQSVLYDVLPSVLADYVSYSAYESINAPDPADTLMADLNIIRNVAGSSSIIVGEAGFSLSFWGAQAVPRTDAVVSAAQAWGVTYTFLWNLYDGGPQEDFGLYDLHGNATLLGVYFQSKLNGVPGQPSFHTL
jgi:hypothetical protein